MVLLRGAVVGQRGWTDLESPLVESTTARKPALQVVGGVTRAQLDQLPVTLEASIVACHLDHDFFVRDEHNAESLALVVVAGGNVHFVIATGSCRLPVPASSSAGLAL